MTKANRWSATPTSDRFWMKVDRRGEDECWPWLAGTNGEGAYGRFRDGDGVIYAHRYAYQKYNGVILPPEVKVLHRCDNPPCCNPKHLFEGSQADNMADMYAKGRGRPRGMAMI